ncbi:hypothetical protein V9T40_007761 [Parthenolecanium corni]|uniref:Uncharacterized protein n=1 Tax=Parthenolecanium corni TaxID=536013 RepID=A0AAN9TY22_9HEMI
MHIVISKNTYRRRSCAAFSPAIPVVGFSAPSSRPPSLDRLFELLGCAAIAAAPIKCSQVEGDQVASYDTSQGFSKYWSFEKSISKFRVASYMTPSGTSSVQADENIQFVANSAKSM